MKDLNKFVDILQDRRKSYDFLWVSRMINFAKVYNDEVLVSPSAITSKVLSSTAVLNYIKQNSENENILSQIKSILHEIEYSNHHFVIRWLGYALVKILKKTIHHLYVNEEMLNKIKSNLGNSPVIFIPTHRSYADFILMAFICFHYGVELPCVAAGIDFHAMWVMGRLLRGSKAFFMRRTFSNDKLYRIIFEEYVKCLISHGDSPVEFFIEGTRSRTAKSLMPKFGFLSMTLETFFNGKVPDIAIIPVNLSYDRLLEESLFTYELLGVPKPKESTKGFLKAVNMLDQNYGNVFVDFGEAISLRAFLNGDFSFVTRSKVKEVNQITRLAFTVINRQQNLQVLSCFNLMSLTLCNQIVLNGTSELNVKEVCEEVDWLSSILKILGATVYSSGNIVADIENAIMVHSNLVMFSKPDSISLVMNSASNSELLGLFSNVENPAEALTSIMLQLYINPVLYLLSKPAMLTVLLQFLIKSKNNYLDELSQMYHTFSLLFADEFVIFKDSINEDYIYVLNKLQDMNAIKVVEGKVTFGRNIKVYTMLSNILYPFIIGYYCVINLLTEENNKSITEIIILKKSQQYIAKEIGLNNMKHYYALSLNLIQNALSSLTSMGVLLKYKVGNSYIYDINLSSLLSIQEFLDGIVNELHSRHSMPKGPSQWMCKAKL